jgi:hypothetical protein
MSNTFKPLALAVSSLLVLAASATAQNTAVAPSDLVLTFQNPGGTTGATATVTAVAGTTGTTALVRTFRDAPDGTFTNLTNIGAALTAAFGPNWYDAPTLWAAAVGSIGSSATVTTITSGDAQRTVYFTRARNSVGTPGVQNSIGVTNPNSSFYTTVSGGITTLKNGLEQAPGATANNNPTFQSTTGVSSIDNLLNFINPGIQAPAFTAIADGIQDNFSSGSFGTFGLAGEVEIALDLFRMQPGFTQSGANPNVTGTTGVTEFLGTLTIDQLGQLAFTGNGSAPAPIPEPTTGLIGAVTALFAATLRRRKVVA